MYRRVRRPDIHSAADITGYCEAFIASFELLRHPRNEAILHTLRAVESQHNFSDVVSTPDLPHRHFRSLRASQDLLRYLAYEIFRRAPEGGKIRPTSMPELVLAIETARKCAEISRVRDAVRAVEIGWMDADVDALHRTVTFVADEQMILETQREQEVVAAREPDIDEIAKAVGADEMRRIHRALCTTVKVDAAGRDFTFSIWPELVEVMTKAAIEQSPFLMTGDFLPGPWSLAAYTIDDYRAFYTQLQVLSMIRGLAFNQITLEGRGLVPHNGSAFVLSEDAICQHMAEHATLQPAVSKEVLRDLRYAPDVVQWTEPVYQPLIPLADDHYGFIGVVVGGSNYERNLLALVDKLPWRAAVSHRLKDERESIMIGKIREASATRSWAMAGPVPLGDKSERVGDIDVLFWTTTPPEALAISLKWFYGPDSVQETWNHSREYRKALKELERVRSYLAEEPEEISRRRQLAPRLVEGTRVFSALVTYQDEVLFRDRVADVPCVTLPQLLDVLKCEPRSIAGLFDELLAISNRRPSLPERTDYSELRLGGWTFRIPFSVSQEKG